MQNWDDYRYFITVARTGSYSLASQSLGVNASTVGRRIDNLESSLGLRLFQRQRHGMTLTPEGRRLLDKAVDMEQAFIKLSRSQQGEGRMRKVVMSVCPDLEQGWLIPKLQSLIGTQQYSELEILIEDSFSAIDDQIPWFRVSFDNQLKNVANVIKLGQLSYGVFAAPNYSDLYGLPADWADLEGHKVLLYEGYEDQKGLSLWGSRLKEHDTITLKTKSFSVYTSAIIQGFGLGLLPILNQSLQRDLVKCDLPCDLLSTDIYLSWSQKNMDYPEGQALKEGIEELLGE